MQDLRTEPDQTADGLGGDDAQYRIGAVSRMAGVPVTTLRVWESRYAAFSPAKSAGRHRLYTDADVLKARLMRQLTASGHGAGRIAGLPVARLQELMAATERAERERGAPPPAWAERRATAVVVGTGLATRVNAPEWRHHLGGAVEVRQVFVNLTALVGSPASADGSPLADLLLVRLNVVQAGVGEQIAGAMARLAIPRAIVLYNYGAEPVLQALRASGILVRREPVGDGDLALLVRSVLMVGAAESPTELAPGRLIPPRRYSDETLARVATSPTNVLCECPRHIAELIGQLAGFEEYSQECLNLSAEDAQLHAYLRSIAGSARALFEDALQRVARHGGIPLDEDRAPAA